MKIASTRLAAVATAAALLATACGSTSGNTGSRAPRPATQAVHTAPTVEQARAQYLALVAPSNMLASQLDALGPTPTYAALTALCGRKAAAEDTLARALTADTWPAVATAAVTALVPAVLGERVGWQTCAASTTVDLAYAALWSLHPASAQAEAVRIMLGMPATS